MSIQRVGIENLKLGIFKNYCCSDVESIIRFQICGKFHYKVNGGCRGLDSPWSPPRHQCEHRQMADSASGCNGQLGPKGDQLGVQQGGWAQNSSTGQVWWGGSSWAPRAWFFLTRVRVHRGKKPTATRLVLDPRKSVFFLGNFEPHAQSCWHPRVPRCAAHGRRSPLRTGGEPAIGLGKLCFLTP